MSWKLAYTHINTIGLPHPKPEISIFILLTAQGERRPHIHITLPSKNIVRITNFGAEW